MYLNAYIDPCPAYGWNGAPGFQTRIVELRNGRERRNADWSQPRHRYAISFLNISKANHLAIKKMVLVCRGMLHAFRFRDQLDYEADDEIFGVGDGVAREFQLRKVSTVDGLDYERYVYAIVSASITNDGVPISPTIDMERGLVIFSVAPTAGNVLRWTGVFDIWVRFAEDYNPFSLDNPDAVNGAINLIEVQPPLEVAS